MSPLLATCFCFGSYLLAYRFYARYPRPAALRARPGATDARGAFSLIEKKTPDPCFQLFIKKPGQTRGTAADN